MNHIYFTVLCHVLYLGQLAYLSWIGYQPYRTHHNKSHLLYSIEVVLDYISSSRIEVALDHVSQSRIEIDHASQSRIEIDHALQSRIEIDHA